MGAFFSPPPLTSPSQFTSPLRKGSLQEIGFFMGSPLHGHAKKGDVAEIRKTCQVRRTALSTADYAAWLNGAQNKNAQTALHVALQHGHEEAARVLLELGVSPVLRDCNGRSGLLYAARYGLLALAVDLVARVGPEAAGADVDAHGEGALHLAATHHHAALVEALARSGLDVNARNAWSETPLHKAARVGDVALARALLQLGADPQAEGREGKPRHVATTEDMRELLRPPAPPVPPLPTAPARASSSPVGSDVESDIYLEQELDVGSGLRFGVSPEAHAVSSKLKRQLLRGSSPYLHGHSSADVHSSEGSPAVGSPVLPPLGSAAPEVEVELHLAGGSLVRAAEIDYLFEPYRALFSKRHWNYVTQALEGAGTGCAIASVPAVAQGAHYPALLRTWRGYSTLLLPAAEVQHECDAIKGGTQADGVRALLARVVWDADAGCARLSDALLGDEAALLSPRSRGSVLSLIKSPRGGPASARRGWRLVEDTALNYELLALELKLGLPKTLSVGVVLVHPDQDEAAAMGNAMSKELELFLRSVSSPVETKGWSGYTGGLSTSDNTTIYYASWQSFEIVFHVAPLLLPAQQRQFIGNDKGGKAQSFFCVCVRLMLLQSCSTSWATGARTPSCSPPFVARSTAWPSRCAPHTAKGLCIALVASTARAWVQCGRSLSTSPWTLARPAPATASCPSWSMRMWPRTTTSTASACNARGTRS